MSLFKGLYPQTRYKDGKRRFWNPVYKKTLLPLPEEIVRHRFLEYITIRKRWSLSRISMETGVSVLHGDGRTDMICYDKSFQPFLLVECKAPHIKLTEKTAHQVIQYNQSVKAKYVCVTNGMQTHFFNAEIPDTEVDETAVLGDVSTEPVTDFDYWYKRGFTNEITPAWRNWAVQACKHFFINHADNVIYLRPPVIYEYGFNHFYHVFSSGKKEDTAWSILAAPNRTTQIILLKSKDSELHNAATICLDELANPRSKESVIISPSGTQQTSFRSDISFDAEQFSADDFINSITAITNQL